MVVHYLVNKLDHPPQYHGFRTTVLYTCSLQIYTILYGLQQNRVTQYYTHVWQCHLETEGYPVKYFERIAVFEAPYC